MENATRTTMSPTKLLLIFLAAILLVHVACALPFWALISHELKTGEELVPNLYILSRLLRFALCLVMAWLVRRRSRGTLSGGRVFIAVLAALALCTILYLCGYGTDFYNFISYKAGIYYNPNPLPVFLVVLWEQIVSIDLLYSALLGSLILTLPTLPRRETA